MSQKNFLGRDGFYWWIGVVENRADPLGLGRCQIRIFGHHGDGSDKNKLEIPTSDLPWAQAMLPINGSKKFQPPRLDDWVMGFFLDGESAQNPVMMGILAGFNTTGENTDPNQTAGQVAAAKGLATNDASD